MASGKKRAGPKTAAKITAPPAATITTGADQGRQQGLKAAAADKKSNLGPFILCSFMFCILCNCLGYVYYESRDFLAEIKVAPFKEALTHDYRDDAADALAAAQVAPTVYAAPVPPAMVEGWRRVAGAGDIDDLRIALRIAYANPQARSELWQSPTTGHRGMVVPTGLRQAAGPDACRAFRITRQGNGTATLAADTVEFCADGAIRQGGR